MEHKTTTEQAMAARRGDLEYAYILMDFVRVEEDKIKPVSKNEIWGKQYIEQRIRGSF